MKIMLYNVLCALCCVFLYLSCGSDVKSDKRVVTVSIEPLRYLTERIAGDSVEVVSMVPGGSSPETYEPTPQQLVALHNSMAYLFIGQLGFERIWTQRLQENANDVPFTAVSKGVKTIRTLHGGHAEEEDPHVWMSVPNAMIMADNILKALTETDPDHRDGYRRRRAELQTTLDSLAAEVRKMADVQDTVLHRSFLIYHPALTYMARDYGWEQICIEEDGKEPSPARLRELIQRGKQGDVQLIFLQQEFDRKNIESIANELNLPMVTISPLSYNWPEQMLYIAQTVYGKGGKP